jgi:outer membrane protein assembly factor BamB
VATSLALLAAGAAPAAGLPASAGGRYAVDGTIAAAVTSGDTVYVGGGFTRIAPRTGSAVVVPESGGAIARVTAEIAGGSVRAAVADGAGGWYVGGSFTSVGGIARPGLAHLRADGTLDPAFEPPDSGLVRALALAQGRLYVGGVAGALGGGATAALHALDAVTGADTATAFAVPPGARGVLALLAGAGRVDAAFGEQGLAAYDAATGATLWSRPVSAAEGIDAGVAALASTGTSLLVGGTFSDTGGANLEALDPTTGAPSGPKLGVRPDVLALAVVGSRAFVARSALNPSLGLSIVDLATGSTTPAAAISPTAMSVDGDELLVSGTTQQPAGRPRDERVYAVSTTGPAPAPAPVSPPLAGTALALAPQAGRLLVGGSFGGVGGVARQGLAAFDARSGALLPWAPAASDVKALAASGGRIYLAGAFAAVSGQKREGLAAVSPSGAGKVIAWQPRLAFADLSSVAVADGRVFAGGTLALAGQRRLVHLRAFATTSGAAVRFWPSVPIDVTALAVWRHTLVAGGRAVTAFASRGDGRRFAWQRATDGYVFALAASGSHIFAGGRFTRVNGRPRRNLAILALDRAGALLAPAPAVPIVVQALSSQGPDVVFGGLDDSFRSPEALGAVAAAGVLEPWHVDMGRSDYPLPQQQPGSDEFGVNAIAPVPGGLLAAGSFSWLGPSGAQAPSALALVR